jgi:hypothetical protein
LGIVKEVVMFGLGHKIRGQMEERGVNKIFYLIEEHGYIF